MYSSVKVLFVISQWYYTVRFVCVHVDIDYRRVIWNRSPCTLQEVYDTWRWNKFRLEFIISTGLRCSNFDGGYYGFLTKRYVILFSFRVLFFHFLSRCLHLLFVIVQFRGMCLRNLIWILWILNITITRWRVKTIRRSSCFYYKLVVLDTAHVYLLP